MNPLNNQETDNTTIKSIFGFDLQQPTDLESTSANVMPEEEPVVPPAFNPFGASPLQTDLSSVEVPDNKQEEPSQFSMPKEEKIETFDMFGDIVTKKDIEEKKDQEKEEKKSIGDQINKIRDSIKGVEQEGFAVELEEYDFEDVYQITVKIKKQP